MTLSGLTPHPQPAAPTAATPTPPHGDSRPDHLNRALPLAAAAVLRSLCAQPDYVPHSRLFLDLLQSPMANPGRP